MAKINWTNEAERWMKKIYEYIAEDNKVAAMKLVSSIYQKVETLERFLLLGHRLSDRPNHHIRILLYGHYRIAYVIRDDETIDILGVFHGALDIEKYLP